MSSQPHAVPCPPKRRRSTRLRRKQTRLAWMMLLPALAVVALVAIYPLGLTVWQSFTNEQFLAGLQPVEFVGLDNYRNLLEDTFFRDAVWLTIKFTVITVAFELVLGLIIALVVNSGFKARCHARRDARAVGDPDRRGSSDVEVDVQRHLRRHQRRSHPNPRDRQGVGVDRRAEHRIGVGVHRRHLEDDPSSPCCFSRGCRSSRRSCTRPRTWTASASGTSSG